MQLTSTYLVSWRVLMCLDVWCNHVRVWHWSRQDHKLRRPWHFTSFVSMRSETGEPFACVFVRRHTPRSSITLLPFGLGSKSQNSTAVQILRPVWFLPVIGWPERDIQDVLLPFSSQRQSYKQEIATHPLRSALKTASYQCLDCKCPRVTTASKMKGCELCDIHLKEQPLVPSADKSLFSWSEWANVYITTWLWMLLLAKRPQIVCNGWDTLATDTTPANSSVRKNQLAEMLACTGGEPQNLG